MSQALINFSTSGLYIYFVSCSLDPDMSTVVPERSPPKWPRSHLSPSRSVVAISGKASKEYVISEFCVEPMHIYIFLTSMAVSSTRCGLPDTRTRGPYRGRWIGPTETRYCSFSRSRLKRNIYLYVGLLNSIRRVLKTRQITSTARNPTIWQ